jgi:two-component SAPR family response regulator
MNTHPRALELNISTDINAFSVTNNQLFRAIAEEVDLETVTNQELREIFFIVRKQLAHLNWKELVAHSVKHLPFGMNQTHMAWEGYYPCESCPDSMIEDGRCYHDRECKALEIYDTKF